MHKPAIAQKSAARTLPFILFALAALALAGCDSIAGMLTLTTPIGLGVVGGLGGEALAIWLTRPAELPPADTEHQIAPHESWCYESAGYAECYAHPVPHAGNRLIMVDPANRYPLTKEAYDQAVADDEKANAPPPPAMVPLPVADPTVVAPPPAAAVTPAPVSPAAPVKKTAKRVNPHTGNPVPLNSTVPSVVAPDTMPDMPAPAAPPAP